MPGQSDHLTPEERREQIAEIPLRGPTARAKPNADCQAEDERDGRRLTAGRQLQ